MLQKTIIRCIASANIIYKLTPTIMTVNYLNYFSLEQKSQCDIEKKQS